MREQEKYFPHLGLIDLVKFYVEVFSQTQEFDEYVEICR